MAEPVWPAEVLMMLPTLEPAARDALTAVMACDLPTLRAWMEGNAGLAPVRVLVQKRVDGSNPRISRPADAPRASSPDVS